MQFSDPEEQRSRSLGTICQENWPDSTWFASVSRPVIALSEPFCAGDRPELLTTATRHPKRKVAPNVAKAFLPLPGLGGVINNASSLEITSCARGPWSPKEFAMTAFVMKRVPLRERQWPIERTYTIFFKI